MIVATAVSAVAAAASFTALALVVGPSRPKWAGGHRHQHAATQGPMMTDDPWMPAHTQDLVDFRKISSYSAEVRRRPGTLIPLEAEILAAALELRRTGEERFHGFRMAKLVAETGDSRRLTAHGTLYKALARLESTGLLISTWEDPDLATVEHRPRRRLYEVTGAAERVVAAWQLQHRADTGWPHRPGLASS